MKPQTAEKVKCRKELYTMSSRGSITVYLSLIFSVILTLIAGSLQSVRMAYARVLTAAAAEQGLYSVFSRFDRKLLEEYELFFLDGGCGTGIWQPGNLYQTAEETVSWVLGNGEEDRMLDGFSSALRLESGSITSYYLATDNHGEEFFRQVCEAMRQNLGVYGIQQLSEKIREQETIWKEQENQGESGSLDQSLEEYDQAVREAEEIQKEEQASGTDQGDTDTGEVSADVPEGFVNPLEVIRRIREMGVLSLVLPSGASVSGTEVRTDEFVSERSLQQGFQTVSTERNVELVDKLLLNEYLLWKFPCYTKEQENGGMQYQVEYAVAGKNSDQENLKSVAGQLLAAREAANLVHIFASPQKRSQVNAMAATIATSLALPVASGILAAALAACWAFAESILDVRELLDGGKVALVKNDASWQLTLENLPKILEGLDSMRKSSDHGLDYQSYLRLLLLAGDPDEINGRTMDLVEYNMRNRLGVSGFCLDHCIFSMGIRFQVTMGRQKLDIERSYNYGTEV